MSPLFLRSDWRSLMTALAIDDDHDSSLHLAAADLLAAHGELLRAAYVRACCSTSPANDTLTDSALPPAFQLQVRGGWIPNGELLCFWHRGFVTQIHGPLEVVQRELSRFLFREPLYQSPNGLPTVSVSDRMPTRSTDTKHVRWTWVCQPADLAETLTERSALLPPELFELLPWPPVFESSNAAAVALSAALLSEAHEAVQTEMSSLHVN